MRIRGRLITAPGLVLCGAAALFMLSGCVVLWKSVVPAASDPNVFSAEKETTDKDYSFQTTGNIYEQGTLVYAPETQRGKLWQDRETQLVPVTNRNGAIRIIGRLISHGAKGAGIRKGPEKFLHWGSIQFFTKNEYPYNWEGFIHSDGTENAQIDFTLYAVRFGKASKLMVINKASAPNVALVFEYVVSEKDTVDIPPPILTAKLVLQDAEYGLYAVTATDYRAKYPEFDEYESELDQVIWRSRIRFDSFDAFLLKPGQKFQIVAGPGVVFAEIFGDTYTLYDACAGMTMTQRKALKESIALFYVFRLLARAYFSKYTANDGYASF